MNKSKFGMLSMSIVLTLSLLFAGCSSNSDSTSGGSAADSGPAAGAQKLSVNMGSEPSTIDPGLAEDIPSMVVPRAAFDGLLRLGPDGKLHEAVAEKYEVSDDKLTYTFHLRDSKWSNGDPVTAQDFEYAWKRVLDPKTASSYAYQLYYLKNGEAATKGSVSLDEVGVKATDDKTLVVTLEHPTPFFPELVASVTYFPVNKKVAESNEKWADDPFTYVGNGPFKLDKWEHKSKIHLVKNEQYWDKDNVKLSEMTLFMIDDANTELNMFDSGDLDWAGSPLGNLPLDAMPALKESGGLQSQATAGTYWYLFNTEQAPFHNKKIRQAFSYAINRQEIVDNILQSKGEVALGILPPSMSYKPDGYFKDGDIETAKKLLAEGMQELKLQKLPEITILYNTDETHQRIAQAIQDQWRKAFGVEVKLKNEENKVAREDMKQGNFQIGRASWIADFNDPINFLDVFRDKGGNNKTGWFSPEYKDLLTKATEEKDSGKRAELLKQADAMIMDEMPAIPIYYYTYAWVKKDSVKDVVIDPLGFVDFKYASNEVK
ncbi:peptide ABC transporter substrate-binding protein [Brevibacillus massiliensis]|uniref:peptide ABC transporter substrate-binding protein n=1 Tax=Brevibacillus massiliensis TaxID=1118054 RepID=UPI0002D88D9A|nr:peptide ABC transporter substrate-binding protein [Brevibacillus massiliensis]